MVRAIALFADTETSQQRHIDGMIRPLYVIEETPALTHHFE